MSLVEDFFNEIIKYLIKNDQFNDLHQHVIKQHTEKLASNGDAGFSTLTKAWQQITKKEYLVEDQHIFDESARNVQLDLVEKSQSWPLAIDRIASLSNRWVLFLNRNLCFQNGIAIVLQCDQMYGYRPKERGKFINVQVSIESDNNLSEYRCTLIGKVLRNLVAYSSYELKAPGKVCEAEQVLNVIISCSRNGRAAIGRKGELNNNGKVLPASGARTQIISCGSINGEDVKMSTLEYVQKRALNMKKTAEMKYGSDPVNMEAFDFNTLGIAVAAFDVLRLKYSHSVPIQHLIDQSFATKGAAFILYNFARVHAIFSTFEERVADGYYSPLPAVHDIDMSLLKEEEEWQLFYVYILGFPSLLERCICHVEHGQITIHLLCNFLGHFTSLFSLYYHRVKILTDNLPQLVPTMNARLYLLRCVKLVLTKSLTLLDIEPLNQM